MAKHSHEKQPPAAGLKELPQDLTDLALKALAPSPLDGLPDLSPSVDDAARLRAELAAKETELESLRLELARRDSAAQPLPDSGPGRYRVIVRHAPVRLKKFECEAANEKEAWDLYCQSAIKKAYNPKDPNQTAIKQFERYLAEGRFAGYDRTLVKLPAAEPEKKAA